MTKASKADYPTYLELGINHGEINSVNGKELNSTGVMNVLDYISKECCVTAKEVITVAKDNSPENGSIKLKLFNGNVKCL
jgi:hypothetical protein